MLLIPYTVNLNFENTVGHTASPIISDDKCKSTKNFGSDLSSSTI